MTSWSATKPGRRTLCTATPPSSPPRVPGSVSFSDFLYSKLLPLRRAATRRAVDNAVPDTADEIDVRLGLEGRNEDRADPAAMSRHRDLNPLGHLSRVSVPSGPPAPPAAVSPTPIPTTETTLARCGRR